jgi:hypothetical protein
MANLSAVPIRFSDGRNVNGLRVQELEAALVSARVPESEITQSKADKMSQLNDFLSKSRASQGPFCALEYGRPICSLSVADLKSFVAAYGGDPTFKTSLQPQQVAGTRIPWNVSMLAFQTHEAGGLP